MFGRGRARAAGEERAALPPLEVVCSDENAARDEAARREATEADERAEWIYLRNLAGQWVARRVERDPAEPQPMGYKQALKEVGIGLLNPFGWY